MKITLAQPQDIAAILEISNWAAANTPANFAIEPESLESWQRTFQETHQKYPWLVATENQRIIGFAKAGPHKGRCAYAWTAETSVYVHPDHHGKRIGTALYSKLIPMLKSQGFVTLIAGITSPNPPSEKLHFAFGFKHVGTYGKVGWKFNKWHDVGYYQVVLTEDSCSPGPIRPVAEVCTTLVP